MDGDETSGPIDFDFFSGESEKSTTVNETEQRNAVKRLSEGSLTTHTKAPREDNNARPHNGSTGPCSSSDNSTDSDSGSNSESDGERSPRSVSSRSTNISVKVPTARDDSGGSESSDYGRNGDKSNVRATISDNDRENNNIGKHAESPERKNSTQTSQRKSVRPRTAKTRSHKKSWSSEDPSESESNSDKEDSEPSKSFSSSHSDTKSSATASESDSDTSVTDVSPLHSPERSPQNEDGKSKKRPKDRKADGVRFVDVTPGYSIHGKTRQQMQDSEARELSVLLRAVLEMDDYPDRSDLTSLQKKMNRPSSGKPRRGGSRPASAQMPHQRMNMSFSNDEVKKIDRENQRLLKKILSTNRTHTSANGSSRSTSKHMSHSAVRRQREQRKIELENMKILQRIESAKASPMIRRDNLVQHYQQQVQYSNQVGKSPHRPSSARRTGSTYVNKMAKASSMSSLNSDFSKSSVATGSTRSRPSSGKRSIVSDTGPPDRARPAWDDHWHVT
ncbi:Cilia- and flagella-associated protein 97 [Holothuria leucospilota]|uniref:Cilia- and flagella-associated protein 97 n=1 Tax=Holothuria leucospilota TaxID=206669 RepID=A0A9Q1BKQ9_HOLLE|nr:Cilia- and flagella-associated protein 97 [Holothuria leucospilota]